MTVECEQTHTFFRELLTSQSIPYTYQASEIITIFIRHLQII